MQHSTNHKNNSPYLNGQEYVIRKASEDISGYTKPCKDAVKFEVEGVTIWKIQLNTLQDIEKLREEVGENLIFDEYEIWNKDGTLFKSPGIIIYDSFIEQINNENTI